MSDSSILGIRKQIELLKRHLAIHHSVLRDLEARRARRLAACQQIEELIAEGEGLIAESKQEGQGRAGDGREGPR